MYPAYLKELQPTPHQQRITRINGMEILSEALHWPGAATLNKLRSLAGSLSSCCRMDNCFPGSLGAAAGPPLFACSWLAAAAAVFSVLWSDAGRVALRMQRRVIDSLYVAPHNLQVSAPRWSHLSPAGLVMASRCIDET